MPALEGNKPINSIFSRIAESDVFGSPVRIAKAFGQGEGMEVMEKELVARPELDIFNLDRYNKKKVAATLAASWVAGNAGVGMLKGVFTDSNGNFDMPLVPGL